MGVMDGGSTSIPALSLAIALVSEILAASLTRGATEARDSSEGEGDGDGEGEKEPRVDNPENSVVSEGAIVFEEKKAVGGKAITC